MVEYGQMGAEGVRGGKKTIPKEHAIEENGEQKARWSLLGLAGSKPTHTAFQSQPAWP